jgi:hypothetical protein
MRAAGTTNGPGELRESGGRPGPRGPHRAGRGRGGWRPRWLVLHAGAYLVINGFLTVTWLLAPNVPGPGEVLVSRTVHDLVAGSDIVLEDRGDHSLRGLAGQWRLYAVRS